MDITRQRNFDDSSYDYQIKEGNQALQIVFAGNLDLYFRLVPNRPVGLENVSFSFDITKENFEIYTIFEALYQEVMEGKVFDDPREFSCLHIDRDYKETEEYKRLVHGKKIEWISDDGPRELEDRMTIEPGEDCYHLTFYRNDKPLDAGFKGHHGISVRIRNSGSWYSPFNCIFMKAYQRLQHIDPDYQQITFDELEYMEKQKQKIK